MNTGHQASDLVCAAGPEEGAARLVRFSATRPLDTRPVDLFIDAAAGPGPSEQLYEQIREAIVPSRRLAGWTAWHGAAILEADYDSEFRGSSPNPGGFR